MTTAAIMAKTIVKAIANLHLFLFQNASFFILLAYKPINTNLYIFLYFIRNTIKLRGLLHHHFNFLFVLQHFLDVFGHYILDVVEFTHQEIFFILSLAAVEEHLLLGRICTTWVLNVSAKLALIS